MLATVGVVIQSRFVCVEQQRTLQADNTKKKIRETKPQIHQNISILFSVSHNTM